jgi:chemotaxis protein methyltransferase CheR
MTEEELELFNEFMVRRFGIHFSENKREILEARLAPRLRALQLHRYMDYYILLQYHSGGEEELRRLASLVTNNESYFFRETHQFEALFGGALDGLKAGAAHHRTLRLLCAGCSSGEEPYTLGIYAKERRFRLLDWKVEIQAFDLDRDRIAMARGARYPSGSLRMLDEATRAKYFGNQGPDHWDLKPMYAQGVGFHEGNILEIGSYPRPFPYDAVFCRNVLIYFVDGSLRKAVENFAACLRPGGLLFLGHSESIIGLTSSFEPVRIGDGIAYLRTPR